jgi:hypothetical protein
MDDGLRIVENTWDILGFRLRAKGRIIFCRTEPVPTKTASGLLWLPPKHQTFHGRLPHMQMVLARVLSSGPKAEVNPGDRICFKRSYFAWLWKLGSEELVGWIDESQVIGWAEKDLQHFEVTTPSRDGT